MQRSTIAPALVFVGLLLLVVGVLIWAGALTWVGRLPGDFRFERPGIRLYAPLGSLLVASLIVTAILFLVRRLWS